MVDATGVQREINIILGVILTVGILLCVGAIIGMVNGFFERKVYSESHFEVYLRGLVAIFLIWVIITVSVRFDIPLPWISDFFRSASM
jgi:hypothetical protein